MTQLEKHLEKLQSTDNFWVIDYHPGPSFSPFSLLTNSSRWKMKLTNYCKEIYTPLSTLQNWSGLYCFWLMRDGRKTPLYVGKSSGNLAERIRAGYFNQNFSYYNSVSWCKEDQLFVSFSIGSTTHEKDMIKTLAPVFNKQHNSHNERFFLNIQTYQIIKAEIEEARIKMHG
mgnify:CR=1 FL=1|tara:strand:- start:47 stop:562 length:516 start_codon:yes stop_codon:yes gene_type:complete